MAPDLTRFNRFLSKIDLDALREQYRQIKIVELRMPKSVQALSCIYEQYWKKRRAWIGYMEFYGIYRDSLRADLEEWRRQCQFSRQTFDRGLPARVYRIWTSLLTQTQGAYVAEEIYGKGNVDMGVDLDRRGRDIVITPAKGEVIAVQIKKISHRQEALRRSSPKRGCVRVDYAVPSEGRYRKDGKERIPYKRWREDWGDRLEFLDNGFVIFRRKMFERRNLLKGT